MAGVIEYISALTQYGTASAVFMTAVMFMAFLIIGLVLINISRQPIPTTQIEQEACKGEKEIYSRFGIISLVLASVFMLMLSASLVVVLSSGTINMKLINN